MKRDFNHNFYRDLFLDIFLPDQEEFSVIVLFHGGGLVEGDKGDLHQYAEHLVNLGYAVAVPNYSLLTNAKFPQMLDDAAQAIRYVKDYLDPQNLLVAGQSAGAWITLMLCFNKEYLTSVGINNAEIKGWISESAQPTSHFNILKYEKGLDPLTERVDESAPLFYVNEKTSFSHLLLMAYEEDLPNRLKQNLLLLSTVKNLNKDLDIEFKQLKGGHCRGSSELDEDHEYETIKVIKEWIKRL